MSLSLAKIVHVDLPLGHVVNNYRTTDSIRVLQRLHVPGDAFQGLEKRRSETLTLPRRKVNTMFCCYFGRGFISHV